MNFRWPWRKTREQDLERELRSHLELESEELQENGLSEEDARYAARRALGNPTIVREETRASWGWRSIETLLQDLRYAVRFLRKSPGFALTAVLSLALGIGMNTAVFAVLNAVLLKRLPVSAPNELVLLAAQSGSRESFSLSNPEFQTLKGSESLTGLAAFRPWRFRTTIHGEQELVNGQLVSGNYFSLLGVPAVLGRILTKQDDQAPGASPVAVLSYEYWRQKLSADPSVVGRTIELQGHPFTVIGVTAPEFFGLEPGTRIDITVPLSMQAIAMPGTPLLESPDARWLRLIGRAKPGLSIEQVRADLSVRWSLWMTANLTKTEVPGNRLVVLPGGQGLYDLRRQFSLSLRALMGAVALFLLIACANLASLLLARGAARQQEIDVRLSLGAGRPRIVRQLLTESTLLSLFGAICGVALAYFAMPLLTGIMSRGRTPIVLDLTIGTRTLLFSGTISLLVGVLFGIVPALRATSPLGLHGVRLTVRNQRAWTTTLISAQIALCLTLLVCAGLLLGSVRKLRGVDIGFRKGNVLLLSIRPGLSNYKGESAGRLYRELYRRFSVLPGAGSVTVSSDRPLGGVSYTAGVSLPGHPVERTDGSVNAVGPRFFETMGIPVLDGRDFTARDGEAGPQIAVISQTLAQRLFPDRSPLGQKIQIGDAVMEVVGVVKETRYNGLREPPTPMVYRPYLQMPDFWEELVFSIRIIGNPGSVATAVRSQLREAAPDVPIYSLTTLDEQVEAGLVREDLVSSLSAWFGGFALLLASIGLYGSLSYAVTQRTRETGIRRALGAGRAAVISVVFWQVVQAVLMGVLAGLPSSVVAARAIRSLLYGVAPFDPSILVAVVLAIAGVALLAGYLPARRASRIDPMIALRYE